ncbi:hypothetical protein [Paraflavitalea speifideaquila]|uniref:hypothetical protein n=1 Tax=Paraflavitalea speifideaquila TaxID=3076558 RepID=UPI0028ED99F8|nr:hypothetical protein [Paraflavitalea speifideiaquila]
MLSPLNAFKPGNNPDQSTKPKAYLNWILLDEQLKYVTASSGAQAVQGPDAINTLSPGTSHVFSLLTNAGSILSAVQ